MVAMGAVPKRIGYRWHYMYIALLFREVRRTLYLDASSAPCLPCKLETIDE